MHIHIHMYIRMQMLLSIEQEGLKGRVEPLIYVRATMIASDISTIPPLSDVHKVLHRISKSFVDSAGSFHRWMRGQDQNKPLFAAFAPSISLRTVVAFTWTLCC